MNYKGDLSDCYRSYLDLILLPDSGCSSLIGTKATQSLITFFTRAAVHQSNQVASFQFTVID